MAAYLSQDLVRWERPRIAFEVPEDFWAQRGIWAPELHRYRGKYYLFLTFNTEDLLPEQWRNWRPRVKRGSQVLVSDSPLGPFEPFANHSTLPPDMMTLDGTLWVEDGVPYMVFCHEWVQIKDGTMQYIRLSDDLSKTVGEPAHMFHGSDALWNTKGETTGEHVTDGPWLQNRDVGFQVSGVESRQEDGGCGDISRRTPAIDLTGRKGPTARAPCWPPVPRVCTLSHLVHGTVQYAV